MSDRFGLRVFGGGLIAGLAIAAFAVLAAMAPKASGEVIDSTSPFEGIRINEYLTCQIFQGEQSQFDFGSDDYDDYCGTFAQVDLGEGGPTFGDPEISPPVDEPYVFDPGNQTLSGDGTAANPYKLVTVVYVPFPFVDQIDSVGGGSAPAVEGPTILRITQTDSYVNGDEHYRTDIDVDNTFGDDVSGTLYHAGDCRVKGFDEGYAVEDDGGFAFCTPQQEFTETATAAFDPQGPDPAILGFVPIDPDANWREAHIETLFGEINGLDFSDLCDNCGLDPFEDDPVDNGVGLSWPIELEADESMHVCFLTVNSYQGAVPPVPSGCTPATSPPATLAQQASSCKLRISRARVFLFRNHPRLRLVARYRSSDPGNVEISYTAFQGGGIFRLRKQLTQQEADQLWTTDRFVVKFKIPGEPGFCSRQYRKELTVPRIVEGQRVIFQEDSEFPQPGSGHPE
jgi:hypothetical protein